MSYHSKERNIKFVFFLVIKTMEIIQANINEI